MNTTVKEIITLGKDSIVQIALTLIHEDIDLQDFTKIKVMSNDKSVVVSFLNPIKYLPLDSVYYFDILVDILNTSVSYGPTTNGDVNSTKKISFYKKNIESITNIQFVIEAINKSDDLGPIDILAFQDNMVIREHENYYDVEVVSETTESSYKIDKISGKIYDAVHAHLEPAPYENNAVEQFIEIK